MTTVSPVREAEAPAVPARQKRRLPPKVLIGRIGIHVMLLALAVIYIFPFVVSVASSLKTNAEATQQPLRLIPETLTFAAYERLFTDVPLMKWTFNSALVTICVTLGRVFLGSLAGYALSRLQWRGRAFIFAGIIAVMAVPSVVLLIPRFLILYQLGIYDSYIGMIVPIIVDATTIFIMKNFFESIPESVEEAARIDGAGVFRTFWSVVLPMARPALITVFILSFQGSWNEFAHFIVSRQDPDLHTLTSGVATLVSGQLGSGNQYPIQLAAAVLMTIPVAILFFIFQRHIMSTAEGAEKG